MKLREYKDLASKKEYMEQIVINTPKEFDGWFEGFGDEKFIYRGSCYDTYLSLVIPLSSPVARVGCISAAAGATDRHQSGSDSVRKEVACPL